MSADFLSGDSGEVLGPRVRAKRTVLDLACEAAAALGGHGRRIDRLAERQAPRTVLVLSVYRPGSLLPGALGALGSARHDVRLALGSTGEADPALAAHTLAERLEGGKLENLNRLLEIAGGEPADWTIVVDDDVVLPERFLDRLVALCELFRLDLAQPAQTQRSHSAWRVTRRRPGSLVRETRFVEIGPVTAFGPRAAALLPFPGLRYGWGLDVHWAALAERQGWRLGVLDALPVRHESGTIAAAYSREEAESEAAAFLEGRPYLPASRAQETVVTHRLLRGPG